MRNKVKKEMEKMYYIYFIKNRSNYKRSKDLNVKYFSE